MNEADQNALDKVDAFLGQGHPLVDQLQATEGLVALHELAADLTSATAGDEDALWRFLTGYRDAILIPVELPAIVQAHAHAVRNETRELITYDVSLKNGKASDVFASASRRMGRHQLARLRPLRDLRLVQRYLAAVETDAANGWHTLVYGVTLAVYSLPIRQGLNAYADRALEGFVKSSASPLSREEARANEWLDKLRPAVRQAVEGLLVGASMTAAEI